MRFQRYAFIALAVLTQTRVAAQALRPEIQVIQNLHFGGLVVGPTGGSVVLTADGALLPDGSGVTGSTKPACMVGRFRLLGPPHGAFTVKVDPVFPVLNHPLGGAVRITRFLGSPDTLQGRFDGTGQAELRLGGHLDIGARANPGLYSSAQVKLQLNAAGSGVTTVQKSFSVSVLLRAPLVLSSVGPLDFGSLIPGRAPGFFEVLSTGGYRSLGTDGPTLVKGAPKPAAFVLQGPPGSSYCIRLPQEATLTGPGGHMKVRGFSCDLPLAGLLSGSSSLFHVGGQLLVDPGQPYGNYRGTFTVEVCYP